MLRRTACRTRAGWSARPGRGVPRLAPARRRLRCRCSGQYLRPGQSQPVRADRVAVPFRGPPGAAETSSPTTRLMPFVVDRAAAEPAAGRVAPRLCCPAGVVRCQPGRVPLSANPGSRPDAVRARVAEHPDRPAQGRRVDQRAWLPPGGSPAGARADRASGPARSSPAAPSRGGGSHLHDAGRAAGRGEAPRSSGKSRFTASVGWSWPCSSRPSATLTTCAQVITSCRADQHAAPRPGGLLVPGSGRRTWSGDSSGMARPAQ